MKMKSKRVLKELERMQRETDRAVAHVKLLDKMYRQMVESKHKVK